MANYTIGDMVYDSRVERGYSQEELCFGICSISTLSRIENNHQMPTKRLFDALLQRLGVSESIYSAFVSRDEMELYRLTRGLVWKLENWEFDNIELMIEDFEKKMDRTDILNWQYLEFVKASVSKYRGENPENVLKELLHAVRLTMPDFAENGFLQSRLLTFDEITILNSIALIYYEVGEKLKGLQLLFELKEYMEKHIVDEEEKAKKYPMILYNIVSRIGADAGSHTEAYNLSDMGISFCVKHNKLTILPYLITNKACAAAELDRLVEAETLFQQAVALFTICNKMDMVDNVKKEIQKRYGMEG